MALVELIVVRALEIYRLICFVYIIMSWLPNSRESNFGQFIGRLVEPFFAPFRQIIPPIGMIDLSPLVAILSLHYAILGIRYVFTILPF